MSKDFKGVRVIDGDNNCYLFQCSLDTNVNSVKDILLSALEGITKFIGYKLVIDGVYKTSEDQVLEHQVSFNFYKRLEAFGEGQDISKEEFGNALKEIIAKAKVSKINSVKVTSFHGEPVLSDSRGFYLKRSVNCCVYGCTNIIQGKARLSFSSDGSGNLSRTQNFIPDDSNAQRYKTRSKKLLCPTCAVKQIPVPVPEVEIPLEIPPEVHEVAAEEPEIKTGGNGIGENENVLKRLLDVCNNRELSAEFVRGYLSATLELKLSA